MAKKTAGIIMTAAFTLSGSKAYAEYISYMDRSEAVRNENFQKYNLYSDQNRVESYQAIDGAGETMFATYNDYMNDPLKTSSLFTSRYNQAPLEEIKYMKEYFTKAQENESPLWSIVYSFHNEWLIKQGYLDHKTNELAYEKIIEAVRLSVESLEKKEGLKGEWSAAIHYNTDNIHVHVGYVEEVPTREWIYYKHPTDIEKTGWQFKGKFKQKNISYAKRTFVNELIQNKEQLIQMEELLTKQKNFVSEHSADFLSGRYEKLFENLYQKLPEKKSYWKYGYAQRHGFKPELDRMISLFINTDGKATMEKLVPLLQTISDEYEEAYGNPRNKPTYFHNQLYGNEGLYARIGNIILNEVLAYAKQQSKSRVMGSFSVDDLDQLRMEQSCISMTLPEASLEEFQSEKVYQAYNDLQSLEEQMPDELEENRDISDEEYQELNQENQYFVFFNEEDDGENQQKNQYVLPHKTASKKIDEAMDRLTDYFQKRDESLDKRQIGIQYQLDREHANRKDTIERRGMYIHSADSETDSVHYEPTSIQKHQTLDEEFVAAKAPTFSAKVKDNEKHNLNHFSKKNRTMILKQNPNATFVYGTQQWKLKGRKVREEEKDRPLVVIAPRQIEDTVVFEEIHVYDIHQTEELPLRERNKNDVIESKRPSAKIKRTYGSIQSKNQENELKKIMKQLRRSCDRSLQHYLNQRIFEEMQYEIDHNL